LVSPRSCSNLRLTAGCTTGAYNDDGTVASTAKSLDDVNEVDENGDPIMEDGVQVVTKGVKSNLIAEVKAQQGALLAQTDWAVIRNADTGDAIPANIATYRAAIRSPRPQRWRRLSLPPLTLMQSLRCS
jgi:hypothetical protein